MTAEVSNLVKMRLINIILYGINMETLCLWQNFDMPVSHIHTFLLIKAGQCATKKFKR